LNSQPNSTKPSTISRDEHAAIFALINKVRLLNGWTMRSAEELDPMIRTWFEMFDRYGIPITAYRELYLRAFDARQRNIDRGGEPPSIDASILVAQWAGEHGLRKELRQRDINSRRVLSENAASACSMCFGSNFKYADANDQGKGVIACDHFQKV
jgi:hypothetical protein